MENRENIEEKKTLTQRAKEFSAEMTKFRMKNPVTRNGGGEAPGKDAEVPGANDPNLERAPKDARFADVRGNTKHERSPKGGEEK